ncbi:MAG: sodium:calcium exchanger, partial [Tabrizicola sp.]|nr:sodium:calcium exchanger [Tabrizicola sp.]
GSGNDVYLVDDAGDVLVETSTVVTEIDTVQSAITFALNSTGRENLENLTLLGTANLNATGNAKANVLTGNTGNNLLSGLDGNDTLLGGDGAGSGNDVYLVDDAGDVLVETSTVVTEIDTVQSTITFALNSTGRENLENLTLLGTSNLNVTGNAKANVLTGNSGNNSLSGLDGNDSLSGGSG